MALTKLKRYPGSCWVFCSRTALCDHQQEQDAMPFVPKRFQRRSSASEVECRAQAVAKMMMTSCPELSMSDLTVETFNISEDGEEDPMGRSYLLDVPAPERLVKNVSFRVDKDTGAIDSEIIVYDATLQRKLKSELYYSRAEFSRKVADLQDLCVRIHKECPDMPLVLNHLRENAHFMAQGLQPEDDELPQAWSNSEGRGLESYMSAKAEERRKLASRRVLRFQSRRHSTGGTTDDKWRAIAERAAMESQQAVSFAAVIGMADAMVVHEPRSRRRSSVKKTQSLRRSNRRKSVDVAV